MRVLRTAVVTLGAASTLLAGSTPASAVTAAEFSGVATIGCFGCGVYGPTGNTMTFRVAGLVEDTAHVGTVFFVPFRVDEPAGPGCLAGGTWYLTMLGREFRWARTGTYASILGAAPGKAPITGHAVLAFRSSATLPCGSPVTVEFHGALHGV